MSGEGQEMEEKMFRRQALTFLGCRNITMTTTVPWLQESNQRTKNLMESDKNVWRILSKSML
jgi:hypothetical protein